MNHQFEVISKEKSPLKILSKAYTIMCTSVKYISINIFLFKFILQHIFQFYMICVTQDSPPQESGNLYPRGVVFLDP